MQNALFISPAIKRTKLFVIRKEYLYTQNALIVTPLYLNVAIIILTDKQTWFHTSKILLYTTRASYNSS